MIDINQLILYSQTGSKDSHSCVIYFPFTSLFWMLESCPLYQRDSREISVFILNLCSLGLIILGTAVLKFGLLFLGRAPALLASFTYLRLQTRLTRTLRKLCSPQELSLERKRQEREKFSPTTSNVSVLEDSETHQVIFVSCSLIINKLITHYLYLKMYTIKTSLNSWKLRRK